MEQDYLSDVFSALPGNYREPVRVGLEQQGRLNVVIQRHKEEYAKVAEYAEEGSKLPLCRITTRVALLLVALVDDDPKLVSLIGDQLHMTALLESDMCL
jgi:hypothetical protein